MSVWEKIRGVVGRLLSVGVGGPQLAWDEAADSSADRIKVLRGDQSAENSVVYARLAGADPLLNQDFATLKYVNENLGSPDTISLDIIGHLDVIDVPAAGFCPEVGTFNRKITSARVLRPIAGTSGVTTVTVQINGVDSAISFSFIPADGNDSIKSGAFDIDIAVLDIITLNITSVEIGGESLLVRLS